MKDTRGTEALSSAAKPAAAKKESKPSSAAKPSASKGREIHHIISKPLKDGSVHHEHVMKGAGGHPDFGASEEYSSASADDAGQHIAQALGGGGDAPADPGAGGDPGAAAAGM